MKMKNSTGLMFLGILLVLSISFVSAGIFLNKDGTIGTTISVIPDEDNYSFRDYGLDEDGNGLYDYLVIEFNLTVPEAGEYETYARLEDNLGHRVYTSGHEEIDLVTGENVISIKISGMEIYSGGINGEYKLIRLEVEGDDNNFEFELYEDIYTTSDYDYTEFERPSLQLTDYFNEYVLDKNNDGLYDYLIIETKINITRASEYEIECELENSEGRSISDFEYEGYFEEGIHTINFTFPGEEINQKGSNGPFILKEIHVEKEPEDIRFKYLNVYTTLDYNYSEFSSEEITEPIIFEEITITPDEVYPGETVEIEVIVENKWAGDQEKVLITVFNEALGLNLSETIEPLDEGENERVLFNFTIPSDANSKTYRLNFEAFWDYDSDKDIYNKELEVEEVDYLKILSDLAVTITTPENNSTVTKDYVWLRVDSNGTAICEYAFGMGMTFSAPNCSEGEACGPGGGGGGVSVLKEMDITGGSEHMHLIEGLRNTINNETYHEWYSIYVSCKNEDGEKDSAKTTFYVDINNEIPPEVDISARLDSVARAGEDMVIGVTVKNIGTKTEEFELGVGGDWENFASEFNYNEDTIQLDPWEFKEVFLTFKVNEDGAGLQEFSILISFNGTLIEEQNIQVTIDPPLDTTGPVITLLGPSDGYTKKTRSSSYEIDFRYSVWDESGVDTCILFIDGKIEGLEIGIQKSTEYVFSEDLDRDDYEWHIECVDSYENKGVSETRDLEIKKKSFSSSSSSSSKTKDYPVIVPVVTTTEPDPEVVINLNPLLSPPLEGAISLNSSAQKSEGFFSGLGRFWRRLFG